MPTPPSTFIDVAESMVNEGQSTSNTLRQGELAYRLLAMQHEKNKTMEDREISILEVKYQAEVKNVEEAAKKRLEVENKKAKQAQAREDELAAKKEKRKYDTEISKLAKG
jgi:hypothetical protein